MPRCSVCGTIHDTQASRVDGERECYCVHCALEDAEAIDDGRPVVEYPDAR